MFCKTGFDYAVRTISEQKIAGVFALIFGNLIIFQNNHCMISRCEIDV